MTQLIGIEAALLAAIVPRHAGDSLLRFDSRGKC